jgi:hypothetical protein
MIIHTRLPVNKKSTNLLRSEFFFEKRAIEDIDKGVALLIALLAG